VETSVTPEPRVKRRTRGRTSAAAEKEVVAEPRPSELAAETDEPSEPTAERTSMLLEETALIRRIQAALQDGDSERALELALAHQRRFANGAFVDERTAAHAEALCALGRRHEARALAATFLRRKPDSHLSARVRAVCRIVAN
jgi:hypothetical protein